MDDDNSSSVRKDEVNNHPSADHSAQKTENKTEKVLPPTNGDNISKSGIWVLATEVVLLGGVATGVWVLGEHFASHGHTTIGGIADYAPAVLFFATLPLVALKRWARPVLVWSLFGGLCILLGIIFVLSSGSRKEPKPHFVLSLQVGDSAASTVVLTNDSLFRAGMVNVMNHSNGFLVFNGTANGCVVIPRATGRIEQSIQFHRRK
jgi:hypothetical protein